MFNLIPFVDPWSEVSPNRSFKHFQHEREERPCQCRIPTPLGRFVSNEGMLSLYFQKLNKPSESLPETYINHTNRACNVGVFEGLPDKIAARTWYMRILHRVISLASS